MDNNKITICENIRKLREKNNMTQAELAEKVDRSDKTISKWENGDIIPSMKMIKKLSLIFNVTINDLEDGYVSDDLGHDKNMEQIKIFMNDINKKLNLLTKYRDVTSGYLNASMEDNSDDYRELEKETGIHIDEKLFEQIHFAEISERVKYGQYDDAISYCDELIEQGHGEVAKEAIDLCEEIIQRTDYEDIEYEISRQRQYVKIYIHHLMKKYKLGVDDFL